MLTLVCSMPLLASMPAPVPDEADALIGWYEYEPGRVGVVTWSPAGGAWLVDLPRRYADSITRDGDGGWVWHADSGDRVLTAASAGEGLRWEGGFAQPADGWYDQTQVEFESADGVSLCATVMLPPHPTAGVVVLQGSGTSSRDNHWAMTFADAMARAGVAVLFPDKRGSGSSGGTWRSAGPWTLGDDAIAGLHALRGLAPLSDDRLGFVGLSQGGWIAPLAAERTGLFAASVSSAAVPPREQFRHEIENTFRSSGIDEAGVEALLALSDLGMRYAQTGDGWDDYATELDRLAADPGLAEIVGEYPSRRDDWFWGFWHGFLPVDPLDAWGGMRSRSLVVYGAEDESDNIPVSRSVARLNTYNAAHPGSEIAYHVYEGLGHALIDPDEGWVSERVLRDLVEWVLAAIEPDEEP